MEKNTGVEMNDDIRTGNGVVGIGFDDKTKVQIESTVNLLLMILCMIRENQRQVDLDSKLR